MASHYVSRQEIWSFFLALFENNPYAAAGACGNMQWESSLASDNAENAWNSLTGHSDEWLTERINNGTITLTEFLQETWWVNPYGFGYGLSQWTTTTRRTELWNRTIAQDIDIDDIGAQLQYIQDEFTGHATSKDWSSVRTALIGCTSVHEATVIYCRQYEGGSWSATRETYAQTFYDEFASLPTNVFPIVITVNGNGQAFSSVNDRVQPYAQAGDTVTIAATPNGDDYFQLWSVDYPSSLVLTDPVTSATNSFTMPNSKVNLTAQFTGETPEPSPYPPVPPVPQLTPSHRRMPIWEYPVLRF